MKTRASSIAFLVGALVLTAPVLAQDPGFSAAGFIAPPVAERLLPDLQIGIDLTVERGELPVAPANGPGATDRWNPQGEYAGMTRGAATSQPGARSLGVLTGNRFPTSYDTYLNQLEHRIRRARRALDG